MTACLRTLQRHRGRRLRPRTFAGIPGYVIVAGDEHGVRSLLAWFPAYCVDPLVDLGMINAEGSLTRGGLIQIGELGE